MSLFCFQEVYFSSKMLQGFRAIKDGSILGKSENSFK